MGGGGATGHSGYGDKSDPATAAESSRELNIHAAAGQRHVIVRNALRRRRTLLRTQNPPESFIRLSGLTPAQYKGHHPFRSLIPDVSLSNLVVSHDDVT